MEEIVTRGNVEEHAIDRTSASNSTLASTSSSNVSTSKAASYYDEDIPTAGTGYDDDDDEESQMAASAESLPPSAATSVGDLRQDVTDDYDEVVAQDFKFRSKRASSVGKAASCDHLSGELIGASAVHDECQFDYCDSDEETAHQFSPYESDANYSSLGSSFEQPDNHPCDFSRKSRRKLSLLQKVDYKVSKWSHRLTVGWGHQLDKVKSISKKRRKKSENKTMASLSPSTSASGAGEGQAM